MYYGGGSSSKSEREQIMSSDKYDPTIDTWVYMLTYPSQAFLNYQQNLVVIGGMKEYYV